MWPFSTQPARRFGDRYDGDETQCRFVSSFGLLKSVPARTTPRPGRLPRLPSDLAERHVAGGALYVHTELLDRFARRVLPRLKGPFTLVTGNSTDALRPGQVRKETLEAILGHPRLIRWHAQNLAMAHPKLAPLPLGLDYHTRAVGRRPGWGPVAAPVAQEAELDAIRRAAPPLEDRLTKAHSNWHFGAAGTARGRLRARLDPAAVQDQARPSTRAESWRDAARCLFTLSPQGRGMDCHRTWEALILGAVPVVEDLPIRDVFAGLPVIRLPDLAAMTPGVLQSARDRVLAAEYDFAPLFLSYWLRRIAGDPAPGELRMRYQDFLDTPLATLQAAVDRR
ncbi:hypothetical protein P1J78_05365 [Psychromarinibacter sp. C21-152]|uniref:Exostosin family protein n=1 Tax=Psychromarinibacter sediminicola TaxID=3033385 RepID=A0AAE3NLQ3_9RHOB|nr:hypothetical protein [Psychromarinibacter sediminicola]MDF0600153.1 hypothetical protein [Psychromarinibacter sediminicola]